MADAADVEGAHGELRSRLADGLRRDDADGLADVDHVATGQIAPIAQDADTAAGFAGEHRADLDFRDARVLDDTDLVLGDFLVGLDQDLAGVGIEYIVDRHAAEDSVA